MENESRGLGILIIIFMIFTFLSVMILEYKSGYKKCVSELEKFDPNVSEKYWYLDE